MITAGGGNQDLLIDGVRCGGQVGEGLYWRIYGKHFERGPGFNPNGAHDDWRMGRGGFRVDWESDPQRSNTLTVQGDHYGGTSGQVYTFATANPPYTQTLIEDEPVSGTNVLARWTHTFDEESNWSLQTYFDRTFRETTTYNGRIDMFDVEFQHCLPRWRRHKVIWGINYRQVSDAFQSDGFALDFQPPRRTTQLFSPFVQDEITLVEDRLFLTVGSKFEDNDYTGFEYQPSARVLWTPDRKHSAWAAISRAVRTPARFNHDSTYTSLPVQTVPFAMFPRYIGNDGFVSENLVAYEIGYRVQATKQFAWDLALFYNVYENLQHTRMGMPFMEGANMIIPVFEDNGRKGETYGVEVMGQWTLSDSWRLAASYSFLQVQIHSYPGFDSREEFALEGSSPHNQARFRSSWDLSPSWEIDLDLRYVDNLPAIHNDAYITMDLRIGWTPSENLELSIVGQNLLDNHYFEFNDVNSSFGILPTEVRRCVFAKATWQY